MYRFVLLIALIAFSASAKTVQQAFRDFYRSPEISPNHCGINTQKFLQYLKDQDVKYNKAYVVSIHEDFGALNHFDARWGGKEFYANGDIYYRSNWYFHVYAVIDGRAYDFSQAGPKAQKLDTYLSESYLPKSKTENIFFQGVLTRQKMLQKFKNLKMKIYSDDDYRRKMGPAKYEGVFIELFNIDNKSFRGRLAPEEVASKRDFLSKRKNSDGSTTIKRPKLKVQQGKYPLLAYSDKICQAFGFYGGQPDKVMYEVSDKKLALYLYTTVTDRGISVSYESRETMGSVDRHHFHYATSVTCANLSDIYHTL